MFLLPYAKERYIAIEFDGVVEVIGFGGHLAAELIYVAMLSDGVRLARMWRLIKKPLRMPGFQGEARALVSRFPTPLSFNPFYKFIFVKQPASTDFVRRNPVLSD